MQASNIVNDEMRRLLALNREGKLTSDQWLAAAFEPLTPLLLLLTPTIVLLAARAGRAGVLLGLVLGFGGIFWLSLSRLIRYARTPLHYSVMTSPADFRPARLSGPPTLVVEDGDSFAFKRRYAAKFALSKGTSYGVYWMHDGNAPVLLSIWPLDHPNAASWRPSPAFDSRHARRAARRQRRNKR